jgi:hypothetical protein
MPYRHLTLVLAGLALVQAGCAAGFRAGGERGGVGAGAAIGPAQPAVVAPVKSLTSTPPVPR